MQVGIFQTLFMHASPADAYSRLAAGAPYDTFRDASTGESMLPLTVLHVIEVNTVYDGSLGASHMAPLWRVLLDEGHV